jgi:hypothetical protein
LANPAAQQLLADVPPAVLAPAPNVYRVCLHPEGLAARTRNFAEWAGYLLGQLRRTIALTDDPDIAALHEEVCRYPDVAALEGEQPTAPGGEPPLLIPFRFESAGVELSLFTTLTTFGTPLDVTLEELAVELFFPADDATARVLRGAVPAVS